MSLRKYITIMVAAMAFLPFSVSAQVSPSTKAGAYCIYNGGWIPMLTSSLSNPSFSTPPATALFAENGGSWYGVACDSSGNVQTTMGNYASAPATCSTGQTYFNTSNTTPYYCSATNVWTAFASGSSSNATSLQGTPVSATPPTTGQTLVDVGGTWTPSYDQIASGAGALADYQFLDGTGSVLTDSSGNGYNGTLDSGAGAPTWIDNGLQFTSVGTPSGVSLPAALNVAQTMIFAVYIDPLTDGSNLTALGNAYVPLLSSSKGNQGENIVLQANLGGAYPNGAFGPSSWNPQNAPATSCGVVLSGFHVFAYKLGILGTSLDRIWVDGTECANYTVQDAAAAVQSAAGGNYYFGSSGPGETWANYGFNGNIYRAQFYAGQVADSEIVMKSNLIQGQLAKRGVSITPNNVQLGSPQFYAVGDSITYGTSAAYSWVTKLSLTNQPSYTIHNYGIPGVTLEAISGSEPNRIATMCKTSQGPALVNVFAGTNDFEAGATVAQVTASLAMEVQTLSNASCRVFVATMLSRHGSSQDLDPDKDAYDANILSSFKSWGAFGIIDFAADPYLGADGAYANTTWFSGDGTHPTTAGQLAMGGIASNSLNYYFGSTAAASSVVSASTTLLSGQRFVDATGCTAGCAFVLPDGTGPSGESYWIVTPATGTVTVVGQTLYGYTQTVNGSSSAVTLPDGKLVQLTIVANPKATSGVKWQTD